MDRLTDMIAQAIVVVALGLAGAFAIQATSIAFGYLAAGVAGVAFTAAIWFFAQVWHEQPPVDEYPVPRAVRESRDELVAAAHRQRQEDDRG